MTFIVEQILIVRRTCWNVLQRLFIVIFIMMLFDVMGVGYVAQEIRSTSARQSPLSVIQIQSISVQIEKDDLLLEKRFFLLLHKFVW